LLFIDLGLRINKILLWIVLHQHASTHIEEKTILLSFFIKTRKELKLLECRGDFFPLNLLLVAVLATFCCKIINDDAGSDPGLP
jgi:hypothetical protein